MPEQNDSPQRPRQPEPEPAQLSVWDAYWDRFRRQQVDDPVEDNRERLWDRFRRQQVDDPVDKKRRQR